METVSLSIRKSPVAAVLPLHEGVQRPTRRLRPRPNQDSDEAEIKGQEEEEDAANESSENEDPQPTTVTVQSSGHKSQHVPPSHQMTPQPTTGGGAREAPAILASETDTGTESDPESEYYFSNTFLINLSQNLLIYDNFRIFCAWCI